MARKMLIDGETEFGKPGEEEDTNFEFDLFVIGAGSGGVRGSRFSANFGAKVGICELPFHPISSETIGGVGGTCVIRGCVPKKILVYGASFGGELEDARNYGWELSEKVDFNWKKLLQKKTDEINRLNGIYKRLLSNAGVKLFEGEGKIVGPNEVEVTQLDGTKLSYSAKHILIATGSRAQLPNIPGQELAITSDEALSLEEFPKRAVILGGGYIAIEFASIWQGMGSTVHLVFRKELPLRGFDDEMRAVVARNLEGRGINLHPRTNLTQLIKTEDGIKVITDHGEELMADTVLFATGRAPNTKRLNLEAVGVELDNTGAIKVDEYSRTNIPSIWAHTYITTLIDCLSSHVSHLQFLGCLRYVNDDEDIRKYFAAFHLHDTLPAAVVIDDFGHFFDNKICQQRYSNPRGRDLAMVKSLALCHNAITYANQKGSCKLLLSDTHTHQGQGDSPRFHFIYKKWIHTTFTIKEGDVSGSFILKDRSYSRTDNTCTIKAAKYSIALQYLVLDGIIEEDQVDILIHN